MLEIRILKADEYRPEFYLDGVKVAVARGMQELRDRTMASYGIGVTKAVKHIAGELGVSVPSVWSWLDGRQPSADALLRIKFVYDL